MSGVPKVSVIVPVYKTEKFIERCVRSLMEQALDEMEYIFVNDCTPDKSMEILQLTLDDYPKRQKDVHVIAHEVNKGSASVRNSGLGEAVGEYVIYCDSDDWIDPEMYKDMYMTAKESDADIVITDYYIDYPQKQIYRKQEAPITGKECSLWMLSGKLHSSLSNKLVRRSLYQNYGIAFYDGVNVWEDMSVMPRLCFYANKVAYLPKAYLHYVQYNLGSYTSNMNYKAIQDIQEAIKILDDFFISNSSEERELFALNMNFLKLQAKSNFIMYCSGKKREMLCKLYPNADIYIFRHPTLSLFYEIILWLGIHNAFKLVDLLRMVYFCTKKCYLKVKK